MDTNVVRFLTLNCWGLPDFILDVTYRKIKNRPSLETRMELISRHFVDYDFVALQEVWLEKSATQLISAALKCGLIYSHSFNSGIIGRSGLLVLSRFPIEEV